MEFFNSLGWTLTAIIIGVVIFLVCRELVLWYFKLNQIANTLVEIQRLLIIAHKQGVTLSAPAPTNLPPTTYRRLADPVKSDLADVKGKWE